MVAEPIFTLRVAMPLSFAFRTARRPKSVSRPPPALKDRIIAADRVFTTAGQEEPGAIGFFGIKTGGLPESRREQPLPGKPRQTFLFPPFCSPGDILDSETVVSKEKLQLSGFGGFLRLELTSLQPPLRQSLANSASRFPLPPATRTRKTATMILKSRRRK
jgi:hypothetical protein